MWSAWTLLCLSSVSAHQPSRMNVLLIISDDLRPEMGCYDGMAITPAIDRLASKAGAVAFDRSYVQQAICNPTRSSFLTSRRPDTTRVWDLKTQFREAPGGAGWKTLPQAFREAGYWSAGMGKVFHPVQYKNQSDDVAGGSWSAPYFQPGAGQDTKLPLGKTNCGVADTNNDDAEYTDGKTALHAIQTLRNVSVAAKATNPTPFFMAVGFHRPHLPWVVPSKYFDMYNGTDIKPALHNQRPLHYNVTGAQQWSWVPNRTQLCIRLSAVGFRTHRAGHVTAYPSTTRPSILASMTTFQTKLLCTFGGHIWQRCRKWTAWLAWF